MASSNSSSDTRKGTNTFFRKLVCVLKPLQGFRSAKEPTPSSSSSSSQEVAGCVQHSRHSLVVAFQDCLMTKTLEAAETSTWTLCNEPGRVAVVAFSNPTTGLQAVAKHTYITDMAAAESSAMHILRQSSALLAPPVAAQHNSSRCGGLTLISEYAGVSIEQQQLCWANEALKVRIATSLQMLACMLLATEELQSLPVPQLHRDIKAGNITYDEQLGLFRLIDFGLMVAADKSNFFPGCTFSHIAPEMAAMQPGSSSSRALCTPEGMAAATSAASDIWALFLTALQLVLGDLPSQLKYEAFVELNGLQLGTHLFCESLTAWRSSSCPQLRHLAVPHPQVAELFQQGLAADPAQRLTVQQALQHPALIEVVQQTRQQVAKVEPAVAQNRAAIRSLCLSGSAAAGGAQLVPAAADEEQHSCSCSSSSSVDGENSGASCSSELAGLNLAADSSSSGSTCLNDSCDISNIACTSQAQAAAAGSAVAVGQVDGMHLPKNNSWRKRSSAVTKRWSTGHCC